MTPNFDVRINSTIKALTEIVLPVVPEHHGIAIEQLEIAIGQLAMLSLQWPYVHKFHQLCLSDISKLAGEIADTLPDHAGRLTLAITAGAELHDDADLRVVAAARDTVAQAVCAVIDEVATQNNETWQTLSQIVLRHESAEHHRDRIWFARTGMDPEMANLPPIDSLFS